MSAVIHCLFQWQFIRRGENRYTIKNVHFQQNIGISWSGHPDGEIVQASIKEEVWVIEDGPNDEYRYAPRPFHEASQSDEYCTEAFGARRKMATGI